MLPSMDGAIGLAAAMAAKKIIGVDMNEDKFEIAKKFGCNQFVNSNQLPNGCKTIEELFQSCLCLFVYVYGYVYDYVLIFYSI